MKILDLQANTSTSTHSRYTSPVVSSDLCTGGVIVGHGILNEPFYGCVTGGLGTIENFEVQAYQVLRKVQLKQREELQRNFACTSARVRHV